MMIMMMPTLFFVIAFLFSPAHAQTQVSVNFPKTWYWVVADTTPGSTVFSSASGTDIAVSNATYQTWLANNAPFNSIGTITNAANNGSGKCRLTINDTSQLTTGQVLNVTGVGGATGCNITSAITVITGTTFDLNSSTFGGSYTSGGTVYGPTYIATKADLYNMIDVYNNSVFNSKGTQTIAPSGSPTQLTTASQYYVVNDTHADADAIWLPQANIPGAYPLNIPITFTSVGTKYVTICTYGGSLCFINNLYPSQSVTVTLKDNTTTNGTYGFYFNPVPAASQGGVLAVDNTNQVPRFTSSPLLATTAAPSSPGSGIINVWVDSTDLRLHDINTAGNIGTTVRADTGASNNFLTAISSAGVISKAQPTFSNLATGTAPAFTLGGTVSGGGNNVNNVIVGAVTPLAGTFTTLIGTGGTHTGITSLGIRDTTAAFDVTIAATSTSATLSAGRTLTLDMGNVAHTLAFGTTANTITFPNNASFTVAGLSIAQTFTALQTMQVNQNAGTNGFAVVNNNASGSATAYLAPSNGTNNTQFGETGTGYTTYGALIANYGYIYNANNFVIMVDTAGGIIAFAAGGNTEQSRVDSNGFKVSATTDATSTTTGSLRVLGGASINKRVFMNALTTSAAVQTAVLCQSSAGEVIADSVACLASSARFKDGFGAISDQKALGMVLTMQPKSWRYRHEKGSIFPEEYYREHIGFVAEDLASIDKRLVSLDKNGDIRGNDYNAVIALQSGAIRALKADNDNLRSHIEQLERKVAR